MGLVHLHFWAALDSATVDQTITRWLGKGFIDLLLCRGVPEVVSVGHDGWIGTLVF